MTVVVDYTKTVNFHGWLQDMINPSIFWLYAGLGLLIATLGAGWVLQSKILNCPSEKKVRFAQRMLGSGYLVIAMGIAYIAMSVLVP